MHSSPLSGNWVPESGVSDLNAARHLAIIFVTASQIFLPIRECRIHRSERDQHVLMSLALLKEPLVDSANITVEQTIQTAGPGLTYFDVCKN